MNPAQSLAIEQTLNAQWIGSVLIVLFVVVVLAIQFIRTRRR